jgi:hypothetical protein
METLTKKEESKLTLIQAREFLEERRGLYNLTDSQILAFCRSIYEFEETLALAA